MVGQVGDLAEAVDRGSADAAGGRVRVIEFRVRLFEILEFAEQEVVVGVGDLGAGLDVVEPVVVLELASELGLPRQKIAMLKQAAQRPASLDAPVNEGEATEYGEIISDESASDPLELLTDKNLHAEIGGLLSILNERERRIIDERFGLSGLKPMLLEDVGREFGVSCERIRQLQNSALAKMRKALMKKDKPALQPFNPGMAGAGGDAPG